jgi:preprotein translocase subunit SecF
MFSLVERLKSWSDNLDVDFVQWRYVFGGLSAVLMLASWLAFFVIGPNWGTDFTGGTEMHLKFHDPVEISDLRAGLRHLGLDDDAVQAVNGVDSGEYVVRIADPTFGMEGLEEQVKTALSSLYGPTWVRSISGKAEVSARFVVDYEGDYKDHAVVARDLQDAFPLASARPGREENQVVIDIPGLAQRIQERIATEMGARRFEVLSTDSVGPKVGADLRRQAFISLTATALLILVYVAFRFDFEYAPGAIVALFHDVTMTIGVFVVLGLTFDLGTIGALLTILGYSINDTIVIYDRIRENRDKFRASATTTLINKSVSETLSRTLTTNFTVFLAIITFLIWGGPVLRNFAIAMLCGQIFGTYSTIYIASPLILVFEDLKPALSRMLAASDLEPEGATLGPGTPNETGGAPVTESEKRRRARAEAEKRGGDPNA